MEFFKKQESPDLSRETKTNPGFRSMLFCRFSVSQFRSCLILIGLLSCMSAIAGETTKKITVSNSDFEMADKEGICLNWNKNAEICFDDPQSGEACVQQKSSGSNWDCILHRPAFPAKENTKYRLTVWNRNTVTSGTVRFGVRLIDANQETMNRIQGGYIWRTVRKGVDKWTKYQMDFTTPPGLRGLNIYMNLIKPKGEIYWDNVVLEEVVTSSK